MIKRLGFLLFFVSFLVLAPAAVAQDSVTGDWIITIVPTGRPSYSGKISFKVEGGKLTGNVRGATINGTVSGSNVHWVEVSRMGGGSTEYTGTFAGGSITGTVVFPNMDNPEWTKGTFTATRFPQRPPGPPRTVDFVPTTFPSEFSAAFQPVLAIWPGDTIRTTTVDAGGKDKAGVQRGWGGNSLTGPFYIQTAMPGDTIAIHLKRIRLNRDWALSDDNIVGRALNPQLHTTLSNGLRGAIKWHLDLENGLASPDSPEENTKNFRVPVRPFLGCVAIAPQSTPISSRDSGGIGGNMDFNEIVEGTTVYLPVAHPGALLFIGDGHAAQGDGELTGNALETSMDVEFSVDVLPHQSQFTPRVESPTHIMAVGLAGSYDDALREATFSIVQWLQQNYKLTSSESVLILGTLMEYRIGEIADRNVSVVAMIRKDRLAGLVPRKP